MLPYVAIATSTTETLDLISISLGKPKMTNRETDEGLLRTRISCYFIKQIEHGFCVCAVIDAWMAPFQPETNARKYSVPPRVSTRYFSRFKWCHSCFYHSTKTRKQCSIWTRHLANQNAHLANQNARLHTYRLDTSLDYLECWRNSIQQDIGYMKRNFWLMHTSLLNILWVSYFHWDIQILEDIRGIVKHQLNSTLPLHIVLPQDAVLHSSNQPDTWCTQYRLGSEFRQFDNFLVDHSVKYIFGQWSG